MLLGMSAKPLGSVRANGGLYFSPFYPSCLEPLTPRQSRFSFSRSKSALWEGKSNRHPEREFHNSSVICSNAKGPIFKKETQEETTGHGMNQPVSPCAVI